MRRVCKIALSVAVSMISFLPSLAENMNSIYDEEKDSVILFRFLPGDLMFYDSPKLGFKETLLRSVDLINKYKEDITGGKAVVVIHGYCTSFATNEANRKAAKNRSNQVKSYFITNYWMKEEYYRTRNHVDTYKGMKDVVAVVGVEYLPGYETFVEPEPVVVKESEPAVEPVLVEETDSVQEKEVVLEPVDTSIKHEPAIESSSRGKSRDGISLPIILKSNLIYDALLAPSLEIEYVINNRWSAGVETTIAWWHNDNKHRYYQIATLISEVRYKLNAHRKGHYHSIGLFGGGGWYDLENKKTGYQGELWMAGLSYSYTFPVNKFLGFEAGAGVGFMSAKYEEYLPQDGHYAYQQTSRTKFFGPLRLKFALVFDFNRWLKMKKGGER